MRKFQDHFIWRRDTRARTHRVYMDILKRVRVFARFKSASSKRWLDRQSRDQYTQRAKAENYRSRAAFKLEELNHRFKLFKPGQTVVDLGFAPGSWSQVAVANTRPGGRVIGVDLLPVQPPEGVSAVQGNFLDPGVQEQLKILLAKYNRGRASDPFGKLAGQDPENSSAEFPVDLPTDLPADLRPGEPVPPKRNRKGADVVLSDMCGIVPQETGFWTNSINIPYRLANTSGIVARDHAQSMDLCDAGLVFCLSQLRTGGSFVCKFYTGSEDSELEGRLKRAFKRVTRVKPDASRAASREAYFVAQKKQKVSLEEVFS